MLLRSSAQDVAAAIASAVRAAGARLDAAMTIMVRSVEARIGGLEHRMVCAVERVAVARALVHAEAGAAVRREVAQLHRERAVLVDHLATARADATLRADERDLEQRRSAEVVSVCVGVCAQRGSAHVIQPVWSRRASETPSASFVHYTRCSAPPALHTVHLCRTLQCMWCMLYTVVALNQGTTNVRAVVLYQALEAWQRRCGEALAGQRALQTALDHARQHATAEHTRVCREYETRIETLERAIQCLQQREAAATVGLPMYTAAQVHMCTGIVFRQ